MRVALDGVGEPLIAIEKYDPLLSARLSSALHPIGCSRSVRL